MTYDNWCLIPEYGIRVLRPVPGVSEAWQGVHVCVGGEPLEMTVKSGNEWKM